MKDTIGNREETRPHSRNCRCKGWMIRVLLILCMGAMVCLLSACGEEEEEAQEPTSFELALITDDSGIDDGSFHQITWEAIQAFAEENGMTCQYYESQNDEDKYMRAIEKARRKGGKLIVLAGNNFETVAYRAQKEYDDLYFVLIDGIPRDEDHNYETGANSTGVLFAEQEAGYLAGYAAVCEGYTRLGFMGGDALPPVKRYGYGFVQGISAAAKEKGLQDISVKYTYLGTFDASDEIESESFGWYDDGTQVIFSCGGTIGESVMAAAESCGGKVIGVDGDQSGQSETVITSAEKNMGRAITDILKNYKRSNFQGGAILNYSAENNGIGLEMKNARFTTFNEETYKQVYREIKNGTREIVKDTEKDNVKDLAGDGVEVKVY